MNTTLRGATMFLITLSNFITGWLIGAGCILFLPIILAHIFGRGFIAGSRNEDLDRWEE